MVRMIIISLLAVLLGCTHEQCEPKIIYKTVEVPVYTSPFDNVSLHKPDMQYFEFSPDGSICLDEKNFNLLLTNIVNYKNFADMCEELSGGYNE